MTSIYSNQSNPSEGSSSTIVTRALVYFVPIWILLGIQLFRVQEKWFDPWDILPFPAQGTSAALLHPLIKGPLFLTFAGFVLGGSMAVLVWKLWRSADKAATLRRIHTSHWIGFVAFTILIFVSRFPIANLWSDPISNLSFTDYVNYNHYIRTAPFILLGFLLFGILFWTLLREEE